MKFWKAGNVRLHRRMENRGATNADPAPETVIAARAGMEIVLVATVPVVLVEIARPGIALHRLVVMRPVVMR